MQHPVVFCLPPLELSFSSPPCVFFRSRVLPLHPHRRVEEPDRRAVHAADGSHGGQLQGSGLHPGSRGGQRAEPAGERHHLSESGRPTQSRCAQLRLGWVKTSVCLNKTKNKQMSRPCRESSVLRPFNTDRSKVRKLELEQIQFLCLCFSLMRKASFLTL